MTVPAAAAARAVGAREQADPARVSARIAAVGGRCECCGQCGRTHRRYPDERCIVEHTRTRPLALAPAAPGTRWLDAARTPLTDLRVWCRDCLAGTQRGYRRQHAERVTAAQADLFAGTWTPPRKPGGTR